MRTNIEIEDELMKDGMKWTGLKSKKEIVNKTIIELTHVTQIYTH